VRLWSVHPRYLDRQGLTAGWREGLLAQKVLTGTTRGYRNHPQLRRFRQGPGAPGELGELPPGLVVPSVGVAQRAVHPGTAIVTYLHAVLDEAAARGYTFDRGKVLGAADPALRLDVTDGQLRHEWEHLKTKLAVRSPAVHALWADVVTPDAHPLFVVLPGPVADWEILTDTVEPDA
jgi:hypothetical protein